ncbi:MAG TPA: ABC transporter permease [Bacteroidales bacterium]|jgi:lipopolysaccharide transport system permease protein|nr:ABC transporter permease [Bacteroidales bacterium]HPL04535.1 ABC transporter permease [Bacteroidales bacterium]
MQFEKQIKPRSSLLDLNLQELWDYRDLIIMYTKRDIVTFYKQTILGPLWFIIQPILTTIMFMFVFGNLAGLSTDGIPQPLFYFSGILLWNYFADCLTRNSKIFVENQQVFGKVYFPRLVVPISIVISNLVRFFIQFGIFIIIYIYYALQTNSVVSPNLYSALFPLLVLLTAGLSLGFGIIFSSLTTKYKDLTFLLQFAVQLWMYATPVIYPLNSIPQDKQWLIALNPMTSVIETFKYGMIGQGVFSIWHLIYSFIFMIILLFLGIIIFNKVEKGFMDTV